MLVGTWWHALIVVAKKLLGLAGLRSVDVLREHGDIKGLAVLLADLYRCSLFRG